MASFDRDAYERAVRRIDSRHQRVDVAPTIRQRLGPWTVVALVLNRTIGSGIFVTPSKVLEGTGSVGASLLLWAFGAIISTAGLLVWLELGLSIPHRLVPGSDRPTSVPRSGGEKNYIEYMFQRPRFLVTCIYGIEFLILGNLSGNAIAFGSYTMTAAGKPEAPKGAVIGLAVGALSLAIVLHVCSRRGGILINNAFAAVKVLLLLAVIILGFLKAGGITLGGAKKATDNFEVSKSFDTDRHDVPSYSDSLLYVAYTFSGFEQPFYVLSEFAQPRRILPKYTLIAMLITVVLFILTNVAYFCAVPKDLQLGSSEDMATLFLGQTFGNDAAKRIMAGFIAFAIFGNIVVMTFTASRVKQEIAKEGVLPWSLILATGHTTPYAWLKARWQARHGESTAETLDNHLEQTPMAALALHWLTSVTLIAVTSMLDPNTAYSALVSLYSYTIIILNGALVSGGLLMMKLRPAKKWAETSNFHPWLDPLHAVIYFVVCVFLLISAFFKPTLGSPFSYENSHIYWYIVPTIGLSALAWGAFWYLGLKLRMVQLRKRLIVTRVPFIVMEDGEWVQKSELIDHEWHAKVPSPPGSLDELEMTS